MKREGRTKAKLRPAAASQWQDQASFAELFHANYSLVFAFVFSHTESVERTKALLAAIFERAYRERRERDASIPFRVWLFRLARQALDRPGRRLKTERPRAGHIQRPALPEAAAGDFDQPLRHEQLPLVAHLRSFSKDDRQLLSLRFDAGLSYAEIAQVMGMSRTETSIRILRAIRKLWRRTREALALAHT